METIQDVKVHLKEWAKDNGIKVSSKGYVPKFEDNLLTELDTVDKDDFNKATGHELEGKMRALHSSSALCVNIFSYLKLNNKLGQVSKILDLGSEGNNGRFEQPFSIEHVGKYPVSLDFTFETEKYFVGIESKFTEPYEIHRNMLKQSYLDKNNNYSPKEKVFSKYPKLTSWLSEKWSKGQYDDRLTCIEYPGYKYLGSAQLIKHILGMSSEQKERTLDKQFVLVYLFYDLNSTEAEEHKKNIKDFSNKLDANIKFVYMSYQDLFAKLSLNENEDSAYIDYIERKYCIYRNKM